MKVSNLKRLIENLSDDTPVVIATYEGNYNKAKAFVTLAIQDKYKALSHDSRGLLKSEKQVVVLAIE